MSTATTQDHLDERFREKLLNLTPSQFENLTYDLLHEMGMQNLCWRTPGPDGGRDIEGVLSVRDFSGQISVQKWYVECKRYTGSVDWPTIFGKVSYAKNHNADFLLMVSPSKFSPTALSETKVWNQREQLQIKLWPDHDIYLQVQNCPNVIAKYSLSDSHASLKLPFLELLGDIAKLLYAAEARYELLEETTLQGEVKVAKELSTLAMVRLWQLETEGKLSLASSMRQRELPSGYIAITDIDSKIDNPGLTAFLYLWKFLFKQDSANITIEEELCSFETDVEEINEGNKQKLDSVAMWANFDYELVGKKLKITQRAFPIN